MVEQQPSKLMTRVRFPSPAPFYLASRENRSFDAGRHDQRSARLSSGQAFRHGTRSNGAFAQHCRQYWHLVFGREPPSPVIRAQFAVGDEGERLRLDTKNQLQDNPDIGQLAIAAFLLLAGVLHRQGVKPDPDRKDEELILNLNRVDGPGLVVARQ